MLLQSQLCSCEAAAARWPWSSATKQHGETAVRPSAPAERGLVGISCRRGRPRSRRRDRRRPGAEPPHDPCLCPVATPERRRVPAATARLHQVSAAVEAGCRRRCRARLLPMSLRPAPPSDALNVAAVKDCLRHPSDRADAGASWRRAGLGDGSPARRALQPSRRRRVPGILGVRVRGHRRRLVFLVAAWRPTTTTLTTTASLKARAAATVPRAAAAQSPRSFAAAPSESTVQTSEPQNRQVRWRSGPIPTARGRSNGRQGPKGGR